MSMFLRILIILLICTPAWADFPPVNFREVDGTPSVYPYQVKVTNGTLTDNGDNTVTISTGSGSSGAPVSAGYLVDQANATLTQEYVVGTTPGGELGGTWTTPTVDAIHSGSAHHDSATVSGTLLSISGQEISIDEGTLTDTKLCTYEAGTGLECNTSASGSPGGSDTQVQYNDSSSFGGDAGMTYDDVGNILTVTGGINTGSGVGQITAASGIHFDSDNDTNMEFLFDGDGDIHILGVITVGSGSNQIVGATGLMDMTKVIDADIGDIDTASGVWSVEDDSHNHTAIKDTYGMVLESPADADKFLVHKAKYNETITNVDCIIDPGSNASASVVIDVQECNSTGGSCTTIDTTITCDDDGQADDGSIANASIDSGDWVNVDIGTVTGTIGTALTVQVTYTGQAT